MKIQKKHTKKIRRKRKLHRLFLAFLKFKSSVRSKNKDAKFINYPLYLFIQRSKLKKRPAYSETINYFIEKKIVFGDELENFNNGIFEIPEIFSIIENYNETTVFLKKLLNSLYNQNHREIYIDYKNCKEIDVCASMCMDILLSDFISFFKECNKGGHTVKVDFIKPINYNRYDIEKILFSIGAYRNIKGFNVKFDNFVAFPILIGNKDNPKLSEKREVDITKTVDYIVESLGKLNRKLTNKAETNFYKVIGEVIQNAEEHSDLKYRYLTGYFEKDNNETDLISGTFNLSILNFGNTFYETFKNSKNPNTVIIEQMQELSKKFTRNGFLRKREFEEETLWTLYALQDGVTRIKDWDRGNGAIRFIESFIDLKGTLDGDDFSKMVITSGHTRIIFDGKYNIIKRKRANEIKEFKMMTFNESGNIEEMPDKNYVKYESNYFPGTLISVKLKLDADNTIKI